MRPQPNSNVIDDSRLAEASLDAVVAMDHAGVITSFNRAAEELFGYARAEAVGQCLAELIIAAEHRAAHTQGLARYVATGSGQIVGKRFEQFAIKRDGSSFPVEIAIVCTAPGPPPVFAGFIRDISERRHVKAALLERARVAALGADVGIALTHGGTLRERLEHCCQAIVTHLGAAFARIWTLNTATQTLELQASAGLYTHIDGPHARVAVGAHKIGVIAKEGQPHISQDVQNDPHVSDPPWARAEGMQSFAGHPLIVDGELVGVMAMFSRTILSDLVIDGLASVADTIAIRISGQRDEDARSALEEQLRHGQKMEAVGRLAGGIAHDFNNMLSVVLSYSELILGDLPPGDAIRDDVEEILAAGKRAADLTRQLLMFSRQQVLEPRVLVLNDLLAGMEKMLRRLVGEDVSLALALDPNLGRACVDPGSIEQVVMNLAINARDAMPTGGNLIIETANMMIDDAYVGTHLGARTGRHVTLSVSDTGCGMDKATMARIFEPFFTTKERSKGTGLGLSTVFGIVEQSGGHVWVESEPDVGTTFKVYIPFVDAIADERHPAVSASLAPGSETILLVEDDDQVRHVARGILSRHGYIVIEAASAGEALLHCETEGAIDLLLTDVVMPQMSGPQLAKRVSLLRPDMKVLFMSGYTDDAATRHGIMDATVAFLQKPLTIESLLQKVRSVLDS